MNQSPETSDDLQRVISFILETEKLKTITRKTKPLGLERHENSAEHSWQLALFALSLAGYAKSALDLDRVIRMLLLHDIGEIDTGDTMVYIEGGWDLRKAQELAAVKRIFGMLPQGQAAEFLELWQEFERGETAESRYAHAIDRAMPVLLNLSNNGQSWRENGISFERVVGRVGPPVKEGCPALWDYLEKRLEEARQKGFFGK